MFLDSRTSLYFSTWTWNSDILNFGKGEDACITQEFQFLPVLAVESAVALLKSTLDKEEADFKPKPIPCPY